MRNSATQNIPKGQKEQVLKKTTQTNQIQFYQIISTPRNSKDLRVREWPDCRWCRFPPHCRKLGDPVGVAPEPSQSLVSGEGIGRDRPTASFVKPLCQDMVQTEAETGMVDLCCSVTVPRAPGGEVAQARAACGGVGGWRRD